MRIGIIGFGYVGSAIADAHKNDQLVIRDTAIKDSATLDQFGDCDAVYVCVPSPGTGDGHCDSSILEQTIKELTLATIKNPDLVVISKTTATPSIYQRIWKEHPNVVHCPEFLTARNNIKDYAGSDYFILGGHEAWCKKAQKVIQAGVKVKDRQFCFTDVKTAALFKYMMNSYLATKVTFMNEFYELAKAEGVEFNNLLELIDHDYRMGYSHLDVPGPDGKYGWGGGCFPKDVAAIIMEAIDLGLHFELLQRVETINKRHRRKND